MKDAVSPPLVLFPPLNCHLYFCESSEPLGDVVKPLTDFLFPSGAARLLCHRDEKQQLLSWAQQLKIRGKTLIHVVHTEGVTPQRVPAWRSPQGSSPPPTSSPSPPWPRVAAWTRRPLFALLRLCLEFLAFDPHFSAQLPFLQSLVAHPFFWRALLDHTTPRFTESPPAEVYISGHSAVCPEPRLLRDT